MTSSILNTRLLAFGGRLDGALFSRTGLPPLLFWTRTGLNWRSTEGSIGVVSSDTGVLSGSSTISSMMCFFNTPFCTFFS